MARTSDGGQIPILTPKMPIVINTGTGQDDVVDLVILAVRDPDGVSSRDIKLIPDPSHKSFGGGLAADLVDGTDPNLPPEVIQLRNDMTVRLNLIIQPAGPPVFMPSCPHVADPGAA